MGNNDRRNASPTPTPRQDFTVAVTPAQLAGGLAIVAGLIAIAVARRRRRRGRATPDEG
jgi:hypothetical protein